MHPRIWIPVRIFIILLFLIPGYASSLPTVGSPLKQSPTVEPYDDDTFLTLANTTIHDLSNQSILSGTDLRNLQSIQHQLATMNISPELYPKARDITSFLYYFTKVGEEYADTVSMSNNPYTPASYDANRFDTAYEYQVAANQTWEAIKADYPGIVPYTLPSPSTIAIEGNMSFDYSGVLPGSTST